MVGNDDQITMKNNYIYKTAGRGPALSGATFLHAVNNANAFIKVKQLVSDYKGKLFSSPKAATNAQYESVLGRACEVNVLDQNDDDFKYTDTSFFGDFDGLSITSAEAASEIRSSVPSNAGAGKLSSSSSSPKSSSKAVTEEAAESAETTKTTSAAPACHPRARDCQSRLWLRWPVWSGFHWSYFLLLG